MKNMLRVCTAIRNAEFENTVRKMLTQSGHSVGPVERDDISNGLRDDNLLFVVEDSYQSILDLLEHQNVKEMNFLPTIIVKSGDEKYQKFHKNVRFPYKYFYLSPKELLSEIPQLLLHFDMLRTKTMLCYQQHAFFTFKELFWNASSFRDALSPALQDILTFLYADKGSVMLLKNDVLVIEAATKREIVGLEIPFSADSVAWTVISSEQSVFVEDVAADPRFEKRKSGYVKDYFLSVPIRVQGNVAGVFNMSDKLLSLLFDKKDEETALRFMEMLEPFFACYIHDRNFFG